MLEKFFNSMDSSIRLLHLKGSATTFTNISAKVENLTDKYEDHKCSIINNHGVIYIERNTNSLSFDF